MISSIPDTNDTMVSEVISLSKNIHRPSARGGHRGEVANVMDCNIVVNEFEFQLHYYVHFPTHTPRKGMNSHISPTISFLFNEAPLDMYWRAVFDETQDYTSATKKSKSHRDRFGIHGEYTKPISVWFLLFPKYTTTVPQQE